MTVGVWWLLAMLLAYIALGLLSFHYVILGSYPRQVQPWLEYSKLFLEQVPLIIWLIYLGYVQSCWYRITDPFPFTLSHLAHRYRYVLLGGLAILLLVVIGEVLSRSITDYLNLRQHWGNEFSIVNHLAESVRYKIELVLLFGWSLAITLVNRNGLAFAGVWLLLAALGAFLGTAMAKSLQSFTASPLILPLSPLFATMTSALLLTWMLTSFLHHRLHLARLLFGVVAAGLFVDTILACFDYFTKSLTVLLHAVNFVTAAFHTSWPLRHNLISEFFGRSTDLVLAPVLNIIVLLYIFAVLEWLDRSEERAAAAKSAQADDSQAPAHQSA